MLKREVIASAGPGRREATARYRNLRKTIDRSLQFNSKLYRESIEGQQDVDPHDVYDEIHTLIKVLKEFL